MSQTMGPDAYVALCYDPDDTGECAVVVGVDADDGHGLFWVAGAAWDSQAVQDTHRPWVEWLAESTAARHSLPLKKMNAGEVKK